MFDPVLAETSGSVHGKDPCSCSQVHDSLVIPLSNNSYAQAIPYIEFFISLGFEQELHS